MLDNTRKAENLANKNPIGVFDSGVGGLTVVRSLLNKMPGEKIIYFGDTARVPYGGKSKETITRFSFEIANFLRGKNVKALVVACNTVSTTCLTELKQHFDIPVFGMVEAGIAAAKEIEGLKSLGVIGTLRTVNSEAYQNRLREEIEGLSLYARACPLFVPLVEEGIIEDEIARLTVSRYLKDFKEKGVEGLILGCTHYPLLLKTIDAFFEGRVKLIEPAYKLAEEVQAYLGENNMLNNEKKASEPIFYVSDQSPTFEYISKLTLGKEYGTEVISLK